MGRSLPRLSAVRSAAATVGNRSGRTWAWAIVALIAAGLYAADHFQLPDRLTLAVAAPRTDTLRATFPYCGDGRRVTCVVDGDTFWLSGERIRIADIDTPELSPPRCEAERLKGEAAKRRLRELLNVGPFSHTAGWRDEDQHGRKLRTVTRHGRSIGDTMIEEGLARRWGGARRSWCG
ncbi:MAG: thermonuclease family protein [Mesorhizobium sp.]|uniref:thermonuclease family protein n=1 Tax=Mesorhizobium sp. TaxID=1871066 RepID=UPI000FE7CFF6|nr:thermonuclease family protein [Mesorhizobium sp.]RWK47799.1 MAG: thermonuclease family protein [Mesorhizobium sp.]